MDTKEEKPLTNPAFVAGGFLSDLGEGMSDEFPYDVFLSPSSKGKGVARPLAERFGKNGVKVWLDEWEIRAGDSSQSKTAKIEEGLEGSRVLVLCMSANTFGADWAQLELRTLLSTEIMSFRDPLNKERRFHPLRPDEVPSKGP